MLTNTAATLYNRQDGADGERYIRTVLRDVSWQAGRQYAFTNDGISGGSVADVFIPFSVDAEGKTYTDPQQLQDGTFTLQKRDYLVKGCCPYEHGPEHPITELLAGYDDVVTVTSVETCDFGSPDMSHWEVGCR